MNLFRSFAFALVLLCAWRAGAAPLPLPYVQDFELTDGGFIPSSATSWKWGPPVAGPQAAHSGTQAWGTNLTSTTYSVDEDAVLKSSLLDLTGATGKAIVIHWWQYLVTEDGFDYGLVEVSRDGGGTWETIYGPRSGAVNDGWTQHTAMIDSSYATTAFVIRFRLLSDLFPSEGGYFIDDLQISAAALTTAVPLQDFETGAGGYTAGGTNSSWAYGAPVSAPGGAFSGLNAWATNLTGLYNADEASALTSPVFGLSAFSGKLLVVSWRQFLNTEEDYDLAQVEVSRDSGATWAAASAAESGPVNIVGWTQRQAFVDASYATAGFRLRFRLEADENYEFDGWAIDDVAIFATDALFPVAGAFSKSTPQNTSINFTHADFSTRYTDPDGGPFQGITIVQLPANGVLKLGGVPVIAGLSIAETALNTLTYEPLADTSSVETFTWSSANFFGPAPAATVTLSIFDLTPQIIITGEPVSQAVNPGAPATFSVTAVSSLPLTYQWRRNLDPIDTATGPVFTIPSAIETNEADYHVIVTNSAGTATSVTVQLSVNDPVNFTQQPAAVTADEGDTASFTVAATGTGRLDFQWYKGETLLANETFSTLTIVDLEDTDAGSYRCAVTNVVGEKRSDPATLTVNLKPRIKVQPVARGLTVKGQVTFSVQAEGTGPFTYQWLRNGDIIPGATASTLLLKDLLPTNEGQYSVRVGNGVATVESDPARLQVFEWTQVAGTYQDVLEHQAPVGAVHTPYPGRVTLSLTAGGRFTASVDYLGFNYRFKGRFNSELYAERQIVRPGQSPLQLQLELDPSTLSLTARVTHSETAGEFRSEGMLPLHRYHFSKSPAPQQGRYTLLLQTAAGSPGPEAPAFLYGSVTRGGSVVLFGKLPDGNPLSCSARVQFTGRTAIFRVLYPRNVRRAGEISGRLNLPLTNALVAFDGDLAWRKPEQPANTPIPAALLAKLEAVGSRYDKPGSNETVITLPLDKDLLDLDLTGPLTGAPLQRWLRLVPGNTFLSVPVTPERLGVKILTRNGRISGIYTDPLTGIRYRFEGVALQAQDQIGGVIMHRTSPGTFLMVPVP